MPPLKTKYKQEVKETRTPEEIAIHSVLTSTYSILTPGYKAKFIWLKNPITRLDEHYAVDDTAFFESIYALAQRGLKDKLMQEIELFAANIDPDWQIVYSSLEDYFKFKEILDVPANES